MYPEDLRYTTEHEWVRVEDDIAVLGVTDFAQKELGDVVFVELPQVGHVYDAGDEIGTIESVKAVSELFAPASGKIVAVNDALGDAPETVASDCYGAGWLVKIEPSNPDEVLGLRNSADYQTMIAAS